MMDSCYRLTLACTVCDETHGHHCRIKPCIALPEAPPELAVPFGQGRIHCPLGVAQPEWILEDYVFVELPARGLE